MKNIIGKRLDGRYEILQLIGVGGISNVYKGYDFVRNCDVAIKVLKPKFSKDNDFLYRFKNECKANASLSHPNIVRIFDVGFGNKMQYIVMEYVEGVTLKEFIQTAKIVNLKDAVRFTFQILRGLQHAHDKGIVHRDMKPQNIMLLEDGTVKIMDFGIARFPKDERMELKKTIGSVHYISPEQAKGEITDFRSDIYSVGVIIYEMLTGKLPFTGKTSAIVAKKQIEQNAVSPAKINPDLEKVSGIVEIIFRALQKNPQARYQSADEMLRDIDEFKQNPKISFGYRYFDDLQNTRYYGTYNGNYNKSLKRKSSVKSKRSRFVPILFGVAGGIFLVSIVIVLTFIFGRGRNSLKDIEIANFVGTKLEDVKTLENGKYKDLGYSVNYEPSSKFASGTIMEQSIKPGTKVKSNYSNIKFTVSSGLEIKTVPDVVGLSVEDAEKKLKNAGFNKIKKIERLVEGAAGNSVVAMEPKALSEIAYDSLIKIYCNFGDNLENVKEVPNVVGKSLQEAETILNAAGFEVSVKKANQPDKTSGVIISQNKRKAVVGSTVELVLNLKQENFEKNLEKNIEKEKAQNKNNQSKNIAVVEVPLKSNVKSEDVFSVFAVDSSNNVISECEFVANKNGSLKFKVDETKNAEYFVMAKNKKTGKGVKYATVKIVSDEQGNNQHNKITVDYNAFAKIME